MSEPDETLWDRRFVPGDPQPHDPTQVRECHCFMCAQRLQNGWRSVVFNLPASPPQYGIERFDWAKRKWVLIHLSDFKPVPNGGHWQSIRAVWRPDEPR